MRLIKIKGLIKGLFAIKTVGARVLVVKDQQILLIRHTYTKEWYTVGGGVDRRETFEACARRELLEEVGVSVIGRLKLFSVYHNRAGGNDDYIALYVVSEFAMHDVRSFEVSEKKWFAFDALPANISPATLRRVDEFLGRKDIDERW